jgi:hypothetical protein
LPIKVCSQIPTGFCDLEFMAYICPVTCHAGTSYTPNKCFMASDYLEDQSDILEEQFGITCPEMVGYSGLTLTPTLTLTLTLKW